jgi:hypothetical protein
MHERLAEATNDVPARKMHLAMAAEYRRKAEALEMGSERAAPSSRDHLDTSGNLLLRGAHGPIGFGFDIAVGLKGLFPLRPWPFEGGFAPVPPSWGHVEAILSSQHHRFML